MYRIPIQDGLLSPPGSGGPQPTTAALFLGHFGGIGEAVIRRRLYPAAFEPAIQARMCRMHKCEEGVA